MAHPENQSIWAVPTSNSNQEAIEICANTLAATRSVPFETVGDHSLGAEAVLASAQQKAAERAPGMILTDWPDGEVGRSWLQFALDHELNGVFLRWPNARSIKRVLIPTSGGSQVIRQLWIAHAVAKRHQCPTQVVHIARNDEQDAPDSATTTSLLARGLGISTPIVVLQAPDVLSGLAGTVQTDDLIVLGAPNPWRLTEHFESTVPAQVAKTFDNPLMMLLGRKPPRIRLRDIFWPQMIALQQPSADRDQVIAQLVEILVSYNQVPSFWRDRLIEQALLREDHVSTAVGSDTAFPHITMPIHGGLTGCMGIFPDGVDFGGENGHNTRFVFMLLTPQDCYSEYLDVLAKISRKLINPAFRQQLLACTNAVDVLALLDPDDEDATTHNHNGPA